MVWQSRKQLDSAAKDMVPGTVNRQLCTARNYGPRFKSDRANPWVLFWLELGDVPFECTIGANYGEEQQAVPHYLPPL